MNVYENYREALAIWARLAGFQFPRLLEKVRLALRDNTATEADYARLIREIDEAGGFLSTEIEDHLEDDPLAKLEAVWLGNGRVRVGVETLALEPQPAAVLGALVKLRAATKPQLVKESGYSEAVSILKKLVESFPALAPCIISPGGRGKGGYRTSIVPLSEIEPPRDSF